MTLTCPFADDHKTKYNSLWLHRKTYQYGQFEGRFTGGVSVCLHGFGANRKELNRVCHSHWRWSQEQYCLRAEANSIQLCVRLLCDAAGLYPKLGLHVAQLLSDLDPAWFQDGSKL